MTGLSRPTARAIATAFPWRDFQTFADIGCAQGGLTAEIAQAHPHLTGFGYDLPAVGPVFERYVGQQGLQKRLTFHPGDFFKDALPSVDVLVMIRRDVYLRLAMTLSIAALVTGALRLPALP